MSLQDGQQHGEPVALQTNANPARMTAVTVAHQRLNFNQERSCALARYHDDTTRDRLFMLCQKNCRGIGDRFYPGFRHRKNTEFVDRAKTILHGPDQAKTGTGIALEIQHGINHVFKYPGPGKLAFLGDVTHQEQTDVSLFGKPYQQGGALAYLAHRARRRLQCIGVYGLDGVDHHDRRLTITGVTDDVLNAGRTQQH